MAQAKSSGKQPNVFQRLAKYFKDVRAEMQARRLADPARGHQLEPGRHRHAHHS